MFQIEKKYFSIYAEYRCILTRARSVTQPGIFHNRDHRLLEIEITIAEITRSLRIVFSKYIRVSNILRSNMKQVEEDWNLHIGRVEFGINRALGEKKRPCDGCQEN